MPSHSSAVRFTAGLLLTGLLVTPALAVSGTVNTGNESYLRVRSEAGTSGRILTSLAPGTEVEVLSKTDGGWYQVTYEKYTGYVSGDYLVVEEEVPVSSVPEEDCYVKVTASSLNIRTGPGTDYKQAGSLRSGRVVKVLEETGDWYKIEGGFICAEYTQTATEEEVAQMAASPKGQQAVDYAMQYLGCSYVHGGNGPKSFDCSGLTKYVYAHFGRSIARTVEGQLKNGVSVSKSELQPGDLVFFKGKNTGSTPASHVGLYIGGGEFIHASSPRVGVITSSLNSKYYTSVYVGARRIF